MHQYRQITDRFIVYLVAAMKFLRNMFTDSITPLEFRDHFPFHPCPYLFYSWPGDHLLHFCEEFMRIINTDDAFKPGNRMTGNDRIKVNSADRIHLAKHQINTEPQIIFEIEELSFIEPAPDPFLPVQY